MGGNEKASVTKEQNEKHRKILDALMKLPENRECVDCKCKGPRWASVNLGVFLCIQCSGIHRSLGVHISKVRSATLDTWLPEQVDFIQNMGNAKANQYWEAELPETFRRPPETDRNGLEAFIRAKYEQRRWIRMTDEERARMKASLRDGDDYRRDRNDRGSYDRPSYDRPRRTYDPDYDRDWSHGAHASYNRGSGNSNDRDRRDNRYDSYDRRDRADGQRGRDERERGAGGGPGASVYTGEPRGGGGDRNDYRGGRPGGDYGRRGDREEPRGAPRAEPRDLQPSIRSAAPAASQAPGASARPGARTPVLTVPLPGQGGQTNASVPAGAASLSAPPGAVSTAAATSATPVQPAAAVTQAQVNKTADFFDFLNVNDPAPTSPAPAAPAPAMASSAGLDAWAQFPDPGGASAAPVTPAATVPGGLDALVQQTPAVVPSPASPPGGSAVAPRDKSDILSLFDTTPMSGPFLMAQQQQQMAAALYAQQQYMVAAAAAGGAVQTSSGAATPAAALHGLAGLAAPSPGSPTMGAGPSAPGGFPGMPAAPMIFPGVGGAPPMPYGMPGTMPMGMYGAPQQNMAGMHFMGMSYAGQPGTMQAGLDIFGLAPSGAAFAASSGAVSNSSVPAPSTGAAFDFSSLTADALRK